MNENKIFEKDPEGSFKDIFTKDIYVWWDFWKPIDLIAIGFIIGMAFMFFFTLIPFTLIFAH